MLRANYVKRFLAVALAGLLLISVSACGSGNTAGTGSTTSATTDASNTAAATGVSKTEEPVVISMWNTLPPVPGIQKNAVADEIERLTGVRLDVVQGDAQKFKVLMAGNDLPDIIYQNYTSQQVDANSLLNSDQLLPLDDLIEKYGTNIKKNFPSRLEYSKRFLSGGRNAIYWLPIKAYKGDPDNPDVSYLGAGCGTYIRWDVYKMAGYPEVKTRDDLLNVLKKMQELYPQTPDGKKVYAISGWSDWGLWPWFISNMYEYGCQDLSNDVWFDHITGKVSVMFSDDRFWESIKFYNKAYRMGLIDPEAFTMKYENFLKKLESGNVLMAYANWQVETINKNLDNAGKAMGFQKLLHDGNEYIASAVTSESPLGWGNNYSNAITRNCKYPEKAIQFLDFMNSFEGARLIYSGIKGKHWDIIDGKPQPTEEYLKNRAADPDYTKKEGLGIYEYYCGILESQMLPDGSPASVNKSNEQKAKNLTAMDKDFCSYYGDYAFPGLVVVDKLKKGELKTFTRFWLYPKLVQPLDNDSMKALAQIDEYMKVQVPKIIMAESDEEFEAEKKKAMEEIRKKGYNEVEAEILRLYKEAEEAAGSFNP